MQMYNALVEVQTKTAAADVADDLIDDLASFHPAVSTSARGWLEVRISLPAETLAQATRIATLVISDATGAEPIACEVMTEAEFDAREGWAPLPQLVSVTEAAKLLGVTRQSVLERIQRGTLQGEKVGDTYVLPRGQFGSPAVS
jgi:excisionase family DNA binding protein